MRQFNCEDFLSSELMAALGLIATMLAFVIPIHHGCVEDLQA